jgi:hypothetical protein
MSELIIYFLATVFGALIGAWIYNHFFYDYFDRKFRGK